MKLLEIDPTLANSIGLGWKETSETLAEETSVEDPI